VSTEAAIPAKLADFCDRFTHAYWKGPFFHGKTETDAPGNPVDHEASPEWEIWVEKSDVSDSWGRGVIRAPLRASIRLDHADAAAASVEHLARMMVAAIAGFEAHEAMEFARFDGIYVINPHGSAAELEQIGEEVARYLKSPAQED